ncbi:hypothetical protein BJX64DRAFT_293218 [Aspergillus heterothallicus]
MIAFILTQGLVFDAVLASKPPTTVQGVLAQSVSMTSQASQPSESRLVKLRNHDGSYKIGINAWRRRVVDAPNAVFDDVYTQQKAYLKELDWLEDDLAASKKKVEKARAEHKTQIAELEGKLAAAAKAQSLRTQITELEAKIAGQDLQMKTYKSRISELEAKLLTQELGLKKFKARSLELENMIAAQRKASSQDNSYTNTVGEEGKDQKTIRFDQTKSTTMVDPPKLVDGAQVKFMNWEHLIQRRLAADQSLDDTLHLDYVINQTAGEAQEQLVARLRSSSLSPITSAKEALAYLDLLYNDPELKTQDPRDFRPPQHGRDSFWILFSNFLWNAVKHKIPEEDWCKKLHEYMQWKYGSEAIDEFSTISTGTLKEVAKDLYLCVLRQRERNECVDLIES